MPQITAHTMVSFQKAEIVSGLPLTIEAMAPVFVDIGEVLQSMIVAK